MSKISLTRVNTGFYSYNNSAYSKSATIIKDRPTDILWAVTIEQTGQANQRCTVPSLADARSLIASV
jgi:hypothetical protein